MSCFIQNRDKLLTYQTYNSYTFDGPDYVVSEGRFGYFAGVYYKGSVPIDILFTTIHRTRLFS